MILFSSAFIRTVQLQPTRQGRCFGPAAGCYLHSLGKNKKNKKRLYAFVVRTVVVPTNDCTPESGCTCQAVAAEI